MKQHRQLLQDKITKRNPRFRSRWFESLGPSASTSGIFMLLMIIKGLFRRYERWNPVHPTLGAFWGMGLGIGCGVGWGPGYGPEVVGYVGAGCGIGFCVGITLVGVGIGLPANSFLRAPYNAFAATGGSALDFARSSALPTVKNVVGNSLSYIGPILDCAGKEARGKLSRFKVSFPVNQKLDLAELKKAVLCHSRSPLKFLEEFRDRHLTLRKGR